MQRIIRFIFSDTVTLAVVYAGILVVFTFLVINVLPPRGQYLLRDSAQTPAERRHFTQYEIKKNLAPTASSTEVLLLHSLPTGDSEMYDNYVFNINNFKQIIESHWNVDIEVRDYTDVNLTTAGTYSHIIFVELNASSLAISEFARIMAATRAKTMWIGCGTNEVIQSQFVDTEPARIIPASEISSVTYKHVAFAIDENFSLCRPITARRATELTVLSTYTDTEDEVHPLITMSGDDDIFIPHGIPFNYDISTYSLPFLDVFHRFLGQPEAYSRVALLRLEDVNVFTYNNPRQLRRVYEYLRLNSIPFHIAFIEYYKNPQKGIAMHADASTRFLNLIKEMVRAGDAVLVQHGYTHQVGDEISGIGFEFWDGITDAPLVFSSEIEAYRYALRKINQAQSAMERVGLPVTDIWETPHYSLSYIDDEVFNYRYPLRYERIPSIGSLPFFAKINGTIFIPENLGYMTGEVGQIAEKRALLRQLNTFETPVASVFWHPWREKDELVELVDMLTASGYEFASVYELVAPQHIVTTKAITIAGTAVQVQNAAIVTIFFFFILGVFIYARNVYRLRKYYKMVRGYNVSLVEVIRAAHLNNVQLPKIALFIPARNEGLVIGNTLRRIANLDYPKEKLLAYVITDEREHDDAVEEKTIDVARVTAETLHTQYGHSFIKILEVPKWYSGVYGDISLTYQKSTKGRALNYCLQSIDLTSVDLVGVLDADGRLHDDILKEVAMKRITQGSKLLQGPVFQVTNFANASIVGVAAGLELALHHLTELPHRLNQKNTAQFLAGTNYFIDAKCIQNLGGWNQHALVEDAELALRMYIKDRTVGEWLNSPELEQTPANFAIYRKQRERWVRGHIDLVSQIRQSDLPMGDKLHFYNKILLSQFRFILDIGLPILAIYLMFSGLYMYAHPLFTYISIALLIGSIFIWDTYGFVYRTIAVYIDPNMSLSHKIIQSVKMVLFLPVFIVVQAIPRVEALYNYIVHPKKSIWYKTERTAEKITH